MLRLRPFLRLLLVVAAILPAMLRADDPAQRAKDAIVVRALLRLPGIDLSNKPEQKAALLRHLETLKGSEQYLDIVEKFQLRETKAELLRLVAVRSPSVSTAISPKCSPRPR
jgi:hypothetical protein